MTRLSPSIHPSRLSSWRNGSRAKGLGSGSSHPTLAVRACCAPAASGVARRLPPTMVTNTRRSINLRSLEELVGSDPDRLRDRQVERLCPLEVDHELELGGLLDGEVSGLGSLEDFVPVVRSSPPQVG